MSTSVSAGIGNLPCFTTFKLFPCITTFFLFDPYFNLKFLQLVSINYSN